MLTVMGKGLSPLQRCILDVAIENLRTGKPDYWGWRHAFKHQVMVRYFGWHHRRRGEYGQQFRVADVGKQTYRAGMASLSRALKRLQALGLIECCYDGYRLTPRARGMEDGLPLDRLGGGAEDQQGAVLAHIAGELRLELEASKSGF
jgi:hypothetical protein